MMGVEETDADQRRLEVCGHLHLCLMHKAEKVSKIDGRKIFSCGKGFARALVNIFVLHSIYFCIRIIFVFAIRFVYVRLSRITLGAWSNKQETSSSISAKLLHNQQSDFI